MEPQAAECRFHSIIPQARCTPEAIKGFLEKPKVARRRTRTADRWPDDV
jgi:hypothetical protein